jgi:putative transposase
MSRQVSKQAACGWYDISRQTYYQGQKRALQRAAEDDLLLTLVRDMRQRHPRMGGRKLHHELHSKMAALGITRGRDAFFDLLRTHDLLVPPKRSQRRTTRSGLWHCPNRLIGLTVTHPNQVWVADITYILTEDRFVYLALLMDRYSRYIVGYDLSSSLAAEGSLRALNQAIKQTGQSRLAGLIHHSDHGVQYTAWPYRERLQAAGMVSSMGEVGNCYENAFAERVIGILKYEYGLDELFVNDQQAQAGVDEAIYLYNYERPHLSLNYQKPVEVYVNNLGVSIVV